MSSGESLLFEPVSLNVSELASYGQIPGFAIGIASTAGSPNSYQHLNDTGAFFFPSEGAGLEAGISDLTNRIGVASGTGRRGLLNADRDAGGATAARDTLFMQRFLFSQAENFVIGDILPDLTLCDATYTRQLGTTGPDQGIMVLGGNNTRALCGQFPLNPATGLQSVTGVGFQPDLVIFLSCDIIPPGGGPIPNGGAGADGTQFMLGAMDGNGSQWVGCTRSTVISAPMIRQSRWFNDNCIAHIGTGGFGMPTQDQLANYVSMDADGFTFNLTQAGLGGSGVNLQMNVAFLALKAGSDCVFEVGNGTQSDGTVNVGFAPSEGQPEVMIFASTQNGISGTTRSDAFMSMGVAGITLETGFEINRNVWEGSTSGPALDGSPTDSLAYYSDTSALRFANCTAVGTLLAEATATLTGTGATLNWTADDAGGRLFGWIAMRTTGDPCRTFIPQIYRLIVRT